MLLFGLRFAINPVLSTCLHEPLSQMKSPLRKSRGVTLVELMIVLAILGILVGLVVPNYGSLIAERVVAAETRRMIGILKLARSEARARGATVTASRSKNDDWTSEVDVFESSTSAGNVAYVPPAGIVTDDLVKRVSATVRKVSSRDDAKANGNFISFNMRGWLSSDENREILIAVCSPAIDVSRGKYIEINRVGKIRERSIDNDSKGCL